MERAAWSYSETEGWILCEPFKTHVQNAKLAATQGWRDNLYEYLVDKCPYTRDQLEEELLRRVQEYDMTAMELVDSFVIEALEGNL